MLEKVELGLAILGAVQLIARAIPTKEAAKVDNVIGKILTFVFSSSNLKK